MLFRSYQTAAGQKFVVCALLKRRLACAEKECETVVENSSFAWPLDIQREVGLYSAESVPEGASSSQHPRKQGTELCRLSWKVQSLRYIILERRVDSPWCRAEALDGEPGLSVGCPRTGLPLELLPMSRFQSPLKLKCLLPHSRIEARPLTIADSARDPRVKPMNTRTAKSKHS